MKLFLLFCLFACAKHSHVLLRLYVPVQLKSRSIISGTSRSCRPCSSQWCPHSLLMITAILLLTALVLSSFNNRSSLSLLLQLVILLLNPPKKECERQHSVVIGVSSKATRWCCSNAVLTLLNS